MVNFCGVFGCSNRSTRDHGVRFFRLPAVRSVARAGIKALQAERRKLWIQRIRREDLSEEKLKYTRVCSNHFISGKPAALEDKDHPDWAPNTNLGHNYVKIVDHARRERSLVREENREKRDCAEAMLELFTPVVETLPPSDTSLATTFSVQTDLSGSDIKGMEEEIARLQLKNVELDQKIKALSISEDAFRDDDDKVVFLTGLPSWHTLNCLYLYIERALPKTSRANITPFGRLIMTLMKMRLNLTGQDLAYRMGGVHQSTVSRVFLQTLGILHEALTHLIVWPSRESLWKTMPMDFRRHCPNCVVIIDCFEIFLERPENPLARAQTYSSYKHHNTVKYLIGITPQGTVSFISEGWGGRVSDKHLTERSGLLDKLLPGDVILADRGFDIKESVGLMCATIRIPAFTKGKRQLSGIEVEQTRRIANVRIHVERVIGNIRKKFAILNATQPLDYVINRSGGLTTLDKIVTVSCGLVNLCGSVVPFD